MNVGQTQTYPPPNDLLYLLPANAQLIVEFGCGTGTTGSQYKPINPHCFYLGIDSNAEAVTLAENQLDQGILSNLSDFEFSTVNITPNTIDCIVYPQNLSGLVHPLETLKSHLNYLTPEGQVIADFTNAQYWQNIVQLLQGNATECLQPQFTLEWIQNLFREAGLQIYEIQTQGQKQESFQQFLNLFKPIIQGLGIEENHFATQTAAQRYIVRATKAATPPRRLLIQTAMMAPTACDRVRVLEPDRFSATLPGIRAISAAKAFPQVSPLPQEEKVFIWQRTIMSQQQHLPLLKQLLQQDYLIIAEIDDNPLRRKEYADNHYLSYRGCHGVQTSTPALATFLKQLNPHVAVFKNQLAYLPPPRNWEKNSSITLFFGALNREKDWQPIIEILNQVLQQYPSQIHAKVIHDQRFFNSLAIKNKTFEPFCSYERYQEILHSCDLALLPLSPTPINLMKSDLKFVECAGHGVAVLASPTVYEQSIIPGETGLIYRTLKQFETHLHELITNPQLRYHLATNAYNWVRNNRLLCQHYGERRQWYLELRDRLPQLNQELRQRVPELFMD
jgi:precorrin-6B methylase 2/glycosyltransferase involved in cell wall biosynthesis